MSVAFKLGKTLSELPMIEVPFWTAWLIKHRPERQNDLRFGGVIAALYNIFRKTKLEAKDIYPDQNEKPKVLSSAAAKGILKGWAKRFGAKITQTKK